MSREHRTLPADERHAPFRAVWADEAERLADAGPYQVEELYSLALQADTRQLYVLTATDPVTWEATA